MRFALTTSIMALAVLAAAAPQPVEKGAGLAIPITKRSRLVNPDKTVNVEALNAHLAFVKAKIFRSLDIFERNTGAPHPTDLRGKNKRATGADPLTDDDDNELWQGDISVGTPPTTFTVDFDTGSSDLFLPGPNCTANCDGHTIYNPSSSSSAKALGGGTYTFEYGPNASSDVVVEAYSDVVTVGGLTASGQTLGAATQYSANFAVDEFPPDGLMGMAFPSLSVYKASPVFQTLITQGKTTESVFSFKLASSGSELYLGGANSGLYKGGFTYTSVTQQAYWQISLDSIVSNGTTIMSNLGSFVDTGTSLIVGPPSGVAQLYQALGGTDASSTVGQGYYTFPCDAFPSVSFTFGGTQFPISEDTLNLGQVSPGSSDCVSGLVGLQGTPSSLWVIGDVFLLNVYTTFDVGNSRVGFAQLA